MLVAVLLVVLTGVQQVRGDVGAQPVANLIGAAIAGGLGYACRLVAKRLV